MNTRVLLVTADDRSGAMEAAALCADAGWPCVVTSWGGERSSDPDGAVEVVDLRSRHVAPHVAAERALETLRWPATRRAHKMDSTLRGNWATELAALASGRRVLLVPAYPSAGRTCEQGVVRVNGVPVADSEFGADLRSSSASSRPAEILGGDELADLNALAAWLGGGSTIAVADASTDAEVEQLVRMAAGVPDVLLAGPALVAGSLAHAMRTSVTPVRAPILHPGAVVVVCGSRHPASRAQALAVEGLPGVTIVWPTIASDNDAEVVALELAVRAHDLVAATGATTVVLLGGDTADAFIGERWVRLRGSLDTGVACGEMSVDGRSVTIVTKPGGFGHDLTVRNLLLPVLPK